MIKWINKLTTYLYGKVLVWQPAIKVCYAASQTANLSKWVMSNKDSPYNLTDNKSNTKIKGYETNINAYTLLTDLDGTLAFHQGSLYDMMTKDMEVLPGVRQKLEEWAARSYSILITTARPESLRKRTEEQLFKAGIFYHQLIMNFNAGKRFLINDRKCNNTVDAAVAINLDRNVGLENINLENY